MKKILILCSAAALSFACHKNDNAPVYGDRADVNTPAEAQDALNQGSTAIVIHDQLTADASFAIPNNYPDGTKVIITVPANGHDITVTQSSTGVGGGTDRPSLELNVADAENITIQTPDMSVLLNGNVPGRLTAATADNTLTISGTVNELVVQEGNVRLLGFVTTFVSVASDSNILYPVSTADDLRNRTNVMGYDHITNGGVFLMANIADAIPADGTLGGITGKQANQDLFSIGLAPTVESDLSWDGFTLDGNNLSLSGAAYNNILAVYANNVDILNLSVFQTDSQKGQNKIEKNGALADADNTGISLYNVTGANLTSVSAYDCGKYGVVVNASEVTMTDFTGYGSTWGSINVDQGSGTTVTPKLTIVSADITEEFAVVVESENAIISVPVGWTSVTEDGVTIYSSHAAN